MGRSEPNHMHGAEGKRLGPTSRQEEVKIDLHKCPAQSWLLPLQWVMWYYHLEVMWTSRVWWTNLCVSCSSRVWRLLLWWRRACSLSGPSRPARVPPSVWHTSKSWSNTRKEQRRWVSNIRLNWEEGEQLWWRQCSKWWGLLQINS